MNKVEILEEIRRTASANGGRPLGIQRFQQETGIRIADWCGKYWARWGDALSEAGFSPNALQDKLPEYVLLERLASICRDLGRFPVVSELRLKKRSDPTVPNYKVLERLGTREEKIRKLIEHCESRGGFDDVLVICRATLQTGKTTSATTRQTKEPVLGFVYMVRSGRHFKIGRSNAAGRRAREIAIQMPDETKTVHVIKTDDPSGIEAYWHSRFAERRLNGEWFNLTAADVAVFKRRKFM